MSDHSDFSGGSGGHVGANEGKHTKKDRKKAKERPYAHLGEDLSSADEDVGGAADKSPVKVKKSKAFMFGSAKKDKKKDSGVGGVGGTAGGPESGWAEGKKKEKTKLKLKKSSKLSDKFGVDEAVEEEPSPIFGVPLSLAVQRHKCHDGLQLPLLVRECIDFIEQEGGIKSEGIYRSSGVKSKVNKLKAIYDSPSKRATSGRRILANFDSTVVASLLKLFLRELPEPVLTKGLTPRFEVVSSYTDQRSRIEGVKGLMGELPECNRVLIEWVFVHMTHVIERERFNKMTLQNVSIVLSPTLKISHRVLNCFFENSGLLFGGLRLKPYIPPLTADTLNKSGLPESPSQIEEEIRKQDSLLVDLHLQISSGAASKKTEEQIWEQQRIVTQLKRKLRLVKKKMQDQGSEEGTGNNTSKFEPIDYNEILNFTLQTPVVKEEAPDLEASISIDPEVESLDEETPKEESPKMIVSEVPSSEMPEESATQVKMEKEVSQSKEEEAVIPFIKEEVIQSKDKDDAVVPFTKEEAIQSKDKEDDLSNNKKEEVKPALKKENVPTSLNKGEEFAQPKKEEFISEEAKILNEPSKTDEPDACPPRAVAFKLPSSTNVGSSICIPSSSGGFPLLPPPPGKNPPGTNNNRQVLRSGLLLPVPAASPAKSKSLPRGFPMTPSEIYDFFENEDQKKEDGGEIESEEEKKILSPPSSGSGMTLADENLLEVLKLEFEYDELMALKSELIRRKEIEKKEILELKEEIASMQTLYQYRTCSVDSSESSSDEASDKEDGIEELAKKLSDLIRENKELEDTRMELQQKIQEDRAACINLRVLIKVEQEKNRLKAKRCF